MCTFHLHFKLHLMHISPLSVHFKYLQVEVTNERPVTKTLSYTDAFASVCSELVRVSLLGLADALHGIIYC